MQPSHISVDKTQKAISLQILFLNQFHPGCESVWEEFTRKKNIKANNEVQTYKHDCVLGPQTSTLEELALCVSQKIMKAIVPLYVSFPYHEKNHLPLPSLKEENNDMLSALLYHENDKIDI